MSLLERAIAIAVEAHAGKVDKAGAPYILHPLRMMLRMATDEARMIAVLHDVVEDHREEGWSFERLCGEGFPEIVINALKCVTKLAPDEDYTDFVCRAASNPLARQVKVADMEDNMNIMRMVQLSDKDVARLNRYLIHWQWIRGDGPLGNPPNMYRAYLLSKDDREMLLKLFPPTHPRVIADHISAEALGMMHLVVEGPATGEVVGYADHDGIQSLIVAVNGREMTSNGTPFHISWSSAPDKSTGGTGTIVRKYGYNRIENPISIDLSAGPTYSAPLRKFEEQGQ